MIEKSITLKEPNLNVTITDHFGTEVLTRIQIDGYVTNYISFPENKEQMTYEQLYKIANETIEEIKRKQDGKDSNSKEGEG